MISAAARPMPLAKAVISAILPVNRILPPFVSDPLNAFSHQTSTGGFAMQLGMHLPHAGSQATPALIKRHAQRAEALGLSDVWVSEHIIVPRAQFPRSPLFYDPVLTLTWVASVTERVRLCTSVIVLPMRHPLPLAKELSTLHNLSGGRLILGVGVGWLEPEFAALGVPFNERGRRMDEGIAMMRAVWSQDPVTFAAKYIPAVVEDMTMLPQPLRGGAPPHRAHRRRLARQPGDAGTSWRDGQAAAPRPAGAQLHDLGALTLGRQGCRHDARPRRGLRSGRRPARHGPPPRPRSRRLGHRDRRRRPRRERLAGLAMMVIPP